MCSLKILRARESDASYIEEKLKKYLLDSTDASWDKFFIAQENNKTVAFGRIIDHGECLEIASLGVDYYYRKKGIGLKMLFFLVEEAKRRDPKKPIYGLTHRPVFLKKAGFKEVAIGPQALVYKRRYKCVLDVSKNKIMKYQESA